MKELKVEDLYFSYDEEFIFEKLSFTLQEGDGCTLLAGKNGAGKSTLINVVCGLLEEDGGILERNNIQIGYLPFVSPFYPHLTILENLRYFYRSFQGKDFNLEDPFVKRVLQDLSIDYLKQTFDKCSSGQQQKASIAAILLSGADLIILDEPFVAIDAKSSDRFIQLIMDMKQETMFLITTHTINNLRPCADRLLFLDHKTLVDTKDEKVIDAYFNEGEVHAIS